MFPGNVLQEDNIRKIKYLFLFAAAFSFLGGASDNNSTREERRYYEEAGGYSIVIPESWQTFEMPGLKYKVFVGQSQSNFTPNINFVDEAFGGDLNFYIDAVIAQLNNLLGDNIAILQRSDFITIKNLQGVMLVTESIQYNRHMRQILYCFPGNNKKILASCTVLAEAGVTYDELFDITMKTFEWMK